MNASEKLQKMLGEGKINIDEYEQLREALPSAEPPRSAEPEAPPVDSPTPCPKPAGRSVDPGEWTAIRDRILSAPWLIWVASILWLLECISEMIVAGHPIPILLNVGKLGLVVAFLLGHKWPWLIALAISCMNVPLFLIKGAFPVASINLPLMVCLAASYRHFLPVARVGSNPTQ